MLSCNMSPASMTADRSVPTNAGQRSRHGRDVRRARSARSTGILVAMTETRLLRPLAAVGTGLPPAVGGVVVGASPATADTPGCHTKKEYRKVHKGMTKTRVHRIFSICGAYS